MLDCVPLPVCHTTKGKCSFSLPLITSSQTAVMDVFLFLGQFAQVVVGDCGSLFQNTERMSDFARHHFRADLESFRGYVPFVPPSICRQALSFRP